MKRLRLPYGIVLCVAVSTPSRDDMDDPAEQAGRADPRESGQNKPNNSDKYSPVIDLTEPRYQQTQYACQ
jgi:hypothetical protein